MPESASRPVADPSTAPGEPLLMAEVQARAARELDRLAPVIDELGRRFEEAGEHIALVGGPVRDALLGRALYDLDFTTSARPERTEELPFTAREAEVLAAWHASQGKPG